MQKEIVIRKLKEQGYRITKQRLVLLDIILTDKCFCCKEIYYKANQIDHRIGTATVYRMMTTLEEIGAISRKNLYKIAEDENGEVQSACIVEFDDNTSCRLSEKKWKSVIQAGLAACGYMQGKAIRCVFVNHCDDKESISYEME